MNSSTIFDLHLIDRLINNWSQSSEIKLSRINRTEIGVSKGRVHLYGMLNKNKKHRSLIKP